MTFTSTFEELSSTKRKYKITASTDQVNKAIEGQAKVQQGSATLKGFRKGKAPLKLVKKYFGNEIFQKALEGVVDAGYREEVVNKGIQVVSQPEFEPEGQFEEGKDFNFVVTVDINTPYEVKGYKDVKLDDDGATVTDSDIEKGVKEFARTFAVAEATEEGTAIAETHRVKVSYVGTVDGQERDDLKANSAFLFLGDEALLVDFKSALVGKKAGDKVEFSVNYKEDYAVEELRGKTAEFKLEVEAVETLNIPELTDEFVKEKGFKDAEDVNRFVRNRLQGNLEENRIATFQEQIVKQLKEQNDVPVPESLLSTTVDRMIQEKNASLPQDQQIDAKDEEARKQFEAEAKEEVQEVLLLGNIARMEGIAVTNEDQELSSEIVQMALSVGMNPQDLVKQAGQMIIEEARGRVLIRRTVKHIVGISTGSATTEEAKTEEK